MGLGYVARHSKIYWDTDPKIEKEITERQKITKAYNNGYSLPHILDNFSQEPKFEDGEDGYGVMKFTDSINRLSVSERPCMDNSTLFYNSETNETVAITYDKEEFEDSMERYWNL